MLDVLKKLKSLKKSFHKVQNKLNESTLVPMKAKPARLSQGEMRQELTKIPYWEHKIEYYKNYDYSDLKGGWLLSSATQQQPSGAELKDQEIDRSKIIDFPDNDCKKVNYGCGTNIIDTWVNVDLYTSDEIKAANYYAVNLLEKHPFPENSIQFGFSEDVLEHLGQAESIFFLSEVYRTLAPGGVFRLSFPGLEGVLQQHYSPISEARIRHGELEAYTFWDHIHFYSKGELELVAKHLGFSRVEYVEYGVSSYPELSGLDTRSHQIGLNTYAELTK